jgi:hypothetical protein
MLAYDAHAGIIDCRSRRVGNAQLGLLNMHKLFMMWLLTLHTAGKGCSDNALTCCCCCFCCRPAQ